MRDLFWRIIKRLIVTVLVIVVACAIVSYAFCVRGHWDVVANEIHFVESSAENDNPECGFYYMYGFLLSDEEVDYPALIESRFEKDPDTNLTMIQINLQNYRDKEISSKGLQNLEALFAALQDLDKQLIVRFLYDWNGENEIYEPESIETILRHMEQTEDVLRKYKHKIYVMQGLFIGNWGEMNGTRYTSPEDLRRLADKLSSITDESTFLSVRMPAQWRTITKQYQAVPKEESIAVRFGLFNDGIMGSDNDCGTYGPLGWGKKDLFSFWGREEELQFQNILCRYVPNGGEVIIDNPLNDFESAVENLAKMHISYLNRDYDRNVLNKWAETIIEDGVYAGMDGLTYIERHLGYRILIHDVRTTYDFWQDTLSVDVNRQNVGFAPL